MRRFQQFEFILASGSPRRQQFLKDIGVDFTIKTFNIDEVYPSKLTGPAIPSYLVKLKAEPFKELNDKQVVITADTIVWSDEQCLGKPKNSNEAKQMLQQLSGKSHEVITAVAFTQAHHQRIIYESTRVVFKPLTPEEMDHYITSFSPFDKAGAYGIQEWIGTIGIEKIEGSYTNVVGLPVAQVLATLEEICS